MIDIDWTVLVQFANFMVLMAVLNILLYRPLRNIMNERQQKVAGGYQKARDMEDSISEKVDNYEKKLQQAKIEGGQQAAELRAEAAASEMEILGEARGVADTELAALKTSVAKEAEKARVQLGKESKGLASAIASKVLGRNVK